MIISDQSKSCSRSPRFVASCLSFPQLISQRPSNFLRWYSRGPLAHLWAPAQGLGLRSARRAGQQCLSDRSRSPEVVEREREREREGALSLSFPISTELSSEVCEELRFEGLGPDVGNHFRGTQVDRHNLHVLNLIAYCHNPQLHCSCFLR